MASLIYDPGPHTFTIETKDGTKYVGKCFAVSISQSYDRYMGLTTTINFAGNEVKTIMVPKKKASKKKLKKTKGRRK